MTWQPSATWVEAFASLSFCGGVGEARRRDHAATDDDARLVAGDDRGAIGDHGAQPNDRGASGGHGAQPNGRGAIDDDTAVID